MQKRHKNREQYFEESSYTSANFYIPFLQEFNRVQLGADFRVCDVGCGEGGTLFPFARLQCEVVGIDIHQPRIEEAISFFNERSLVGTFLHTDVFDFFPEQKQFDLIILHDVIEHILDKERLLLHLKKLLAPNGVIFIAFPAWQMPFGGHQQVVKSKFISHMPYIHLLPKKAYRALYKLAGESEGNTEYMMDIVRTKMTIEGFVKLTDKTQYEIIGRRYYFINPHYKVKFGLKPKTLSPLIGNVPFVRNFFTTSCFWIIKPHKN